MYLARIPFVLFVCLMSHLNVFAVDWPQWRGTDQTGVSQETGLLDAWPEAGPELAWKATGLGKGFSSVAIAESMIYTCGDIDIGSNLFEITKKESQFEATEKYATKSMANQHGGVVLLGDYLYGYCDSKGWTCQSLATGKPVWTEKKQCGKGVLTSAQGMLYLRSEDKGTVALIKATTDGYQETGNFIQPDFGKPKTWAHPVVSGKKLYLRDQDMLLCYDIGAE